MQTPTWTSRLTVAEAIKWLGSQHVAHLLTDWPRLAQNARMGAWHANDGANVAAYNALLEAGSYETTAGLVEKKPGYPNSTE